MRFGRFFSSCGTCIDDATLESCEGSTKSAKSDKLGDVELGEFQRSIDPYGTYLVWLWIYECIFCNGYGSY